MVQPNTLDRICRDYNTVCYVWRLWNQCELPALDKARRSQTRFFSGCGSARSSSRRNFSGVEDSLLEALRRLRVNRRQEMQGHGVYRACDYREFRPFPNQHPCGTLIADLVDARRVRCCKHFGV